MSKKRFYFRNYFIIFILVCAFLYIAQRYNNKIDISVLEYGELEDLVSVDGVIIKDEAIVSSKCIGNVKFYYGEGQKVSKGTYLADISTSDSSEQINTELILINEALEGKKDVITIGTSDNDKYSKYTADELTLLKQSYEKALENNKLPVFSSKSGFVTYCFDGLENSFDYSEALNIMPSKLFDVVESRTNTYSIDNVNTGDLLLKVVNNFEYYMACLVNNSDITKYEEGKYIRVRIEGSEKFIYGIIEKINAGTEQSALIISFCDFFYKVYNKRIVKAELINNIYAGIMVDKRAVVEVDGIRGVYVKDISNIIKFFPISIIGQDDSCYVVSQGEIIGENERGRITINDKIYSTVKTFDKVVLDTEKVYEGQIVD